MRNRVYAILLLLILVVGGLWAYRHFSPYQLCLRANIHEGITQGQTREQAIQYAEGLCTAKMPLRN